MPFLAKKSKGIRSDSLEDLADSVKDLAAYTEDEFSAVASAMQSTEPDTIWNSVPPKPRRGTYAYADGTNWNPGSGEGPYFFDGTNWTPTKAPVTNTANFGYELGSVSTPNSPFIDFHSSGNNIDYDSRIIASGGTSTVGTGTLSVKAGSFKVDGASNYLTVDNTGLTVASLTVSAAAVVTGALKVGTTLSVGNVVVSGTAGDINVVRPGAPTTGAIFIGNSGARYLFYDGSNYTLAGAHVFSAAGRLLGTTTDAGVVQNGRLAYLADVSVNAGAMTEPYSGGVITGFDYFNGNARFRQMQLQNYAGTWFAIGYV